jgi:uncharacterized cupin superfamily protein
MTLPIPGLVSDTAFEEVPVDADQIISGSPVTTTRPLGASAGPVELGIWTISVGTVTDIEAAETFVVLSGLAVLTVNDQTPYPIGAGDIVTFDEGDRTVWDVREPLRKFYVTYLESTSL